MQQDCRNNPCQRFGSALNLNIHLHLLVLDGAYTFAAGYPRFHRALAPTSDELERLLEALIRRTVRTLTRAGALVAGPEAESAQPYLDLDRPDDDALAALESASVRYRIAVGQIAGRKTLRLQVAGASATHLESGKALTVTRDGFSARTLQCPAGPASERSSSGCAATSPGPRSRWNV